MRLRTPALFALTLAAACSDAAPTAHHPAPAPPTPLAALDCVADAGALTLTCRPAGPAGGGPARDVVVGGQGIFVLLTSGPPAFDGGTRVFRAPVTVRNLIGQAIGTRDGVSVAPEGVSVFFPTDPSDGATVRNPSGVGTYTGSDQPYHRYPQRLAPGEESAARSWEFDVPAGVSSFTFQVYVSAPVPHPNGWVEVTPGALSLPAGGTQPLSATVRDVLGRPLAGQAVSWSSAAPAVATVDSVGGARALTTGSVVLTASSGVRSGSATLTVTAAAGAAGNPDSAGVRFTIDASRRTPISRFIYGMNFLDQYGVYDPWQHKPLPANLTLSRLGGNRLSAYNWENNASNAGFDFHYQNDDYLLAGGPNVVGEATRARAAAAFARDAGIMVTVPMLGYAAADLGGPMGVSEDSLAIRLATRFRRSLPRKPGAFTMQPDLADSAVYQDEFVWWLNRQFPAARHDPLRPIFYSLDNEPDIWHSTHEEVRSRVGGAPRLLSYTDLAQRTVAHASAIKDVVPNAVVFGPALATYTGITTLGRWPVADSVAGTAEFLGWYLDRMREAEQQQGRRLLDVVDVHWYSEVHADAGRITNDYNPQTDSTKRARMQAPRSLWDPTYRENSWVANDVVGGPIRLLPRLRETIAQHYPGTKLAITEYYYGRGGDISGGIAQADALGVFGREGLFAATLWPDAGIWASPYGGDVSKAYAYVFGAFRAYRDYDGAGGSFGDLSLAATSTDWARASVFASVDSGDPDRVVLVVINKAESPLSAGISVAHPAAFSRAEVYTMRDGAPTPVRGADVTVGVGNAFKVVMPPLSVSTLVMRR